MRRSGLAVVLVLPLATLLLSGCTAISDLQRFVDHAQGKAEFAEVQKLDEHLDFAPGDLPPPSVPPAVAFKVADYNFTIAAGAQSLHVDVAVRFDALPATLPPGLPGLPASAPQGNVNITVSSPQGVLTTLIFMQTNSTAVDQGAPAAGTWSVHVEAAGSGTVRVLATAVELQKR